MEIQEFNQTIFALLIQNQIAQNLIPYTLQFFLISGGSHFSKSTDQIIILSFIEGILKINIVDLIITDLFVQCLLLLVDEEIQI
jgi:hypothetical protein